MQPRRLQIAVRVVTVVRVGWGDSGRSGESGDSFGLGGEGLTPSG